MPKDNYRRVSLFSPSFLLIILLSIILLGTIFWHLGFVRERDRQEYQQLMANAQTSYSSERGTAHQERQDIQKDLFFYRGNNRLRARLSADKAKLILDYQDAQTNVIEQMQNVKCYIQEELYYLLPDSREALLQPNGQLLLRAADEKDQGSWVALDTPGLKPQQMISYIEAEEAEYHYKDDRFVAHSVKITRYSLPDHQLKENDDQISPLMQGSAKRIEFVLNDPDPNMKAQNLKATFAFPSNSHGNQKPSSMFVDSESVEYNGKILLLKGNASVDHELGKIEAQQIVLIPENESKKLCLASIEIRDQVKIAFRKGGLLRCEEAKIDCSKLSGKFIGGAHQKHVIYTENYLELASPEMTVQLQRGNTQNPSTLIIQQISANKNVNVNYKNEMGFTCETLTWDEPEDILTLSGQVEVNYLDVGTISNPCEVKVHRRTVNGQKQISIIDSLGHSIFSYKDEKTKENHQLTTYNKFTLDHQAMVAHLDSPRDINNNVIESLQVHFSDSLGEIYADEVFINYKDINKKMTPTKLLLKGNVWLLGRTAVDKDDPGQIVQFAMADQAEYDISSRELLCMATVNKRVLFFDKNNNLQISAPKVKAKRDLITKKDAIQGIGDVRFSFIDQEFERLKKRLEKIGIGYE